MNDLHRFAIFPYLATSRPVEVCGVSFRSTNDKESLTDAAREHLEALASLFFLQDHLQIEDMTYAYLPLETSQEADGLLMLRVRKAQAFFAYLYGSPGYDGGPFYGLEHSSLFLLYPGKVSEFSLRSERRVTSRWPEDLWPDFDQFHDTLGYQGKLNWANHISAIPGSRIFPPSPHLWLNYSQDLHSDLMRYGASMPHWATLAFFNNPPNEDSELERRVLNSIDWHNRSASLAATEDVALLHLAIALESLLNLEPGDKVTERFKETVRTLLGPLPRLEWWADQFYQARSKIAHQGNWSHLRFHPVDKDRRAKMLKGETAPEPYRSLTDYGRRIFRLCLNTILAGAIQAEDAKLAASFVPNGERLANINRTMSNAALSAAQKLKAVPRDLLELHEFNRLAEDAINLGLLVSLGRSLCRAFLDTAPDIPAMVKDDVNAVLGDDAALSATEKLDRFKKLSQSLHDWKGPTPIYQQYSDEDWQIDEMRKDFGLVLWVFMEYAAGPHLHMQAWRDDQRETSDKQT